MYLDHALTLLFSMCSILIFLNVSALWRDREIKGVSVIPMVLFFLVDLLQAIRFINEGSYALAAGAFLMCVASAAWLGLVAFFASNRVS